MTVLTLLFCLALKSLSQKVNLVSKSHNERLRALGSCFLFDKKVNYSRDLSFNLVKNNYSGDLNYRLVRLSEQ